MTSTNPTHLEEVIDQVLSKLETLDPGTPEFAAVTDQLIKLINATPTKEPFVKPEVLITVAGNLIGILSILNFERANVITSKAIGFVLKSRI